MAETILILGGTREAAALAIDLVAEHPDWRVITSLAGRTKEPAPVAGETRIGGFGGADGLADYLRSNAVTRLIDATHPFATQISANAKLAAQIAGIPLEVHCRPPWEKQPGDRWIEVPSLVATQDAMPAGSRVLLALGSQHIGLFATRHDVHFVVRMVDAPDEPLGLPDHTLIIGKPATDPAREQAMLAANAISHIVCRNSGGQGAYAKIVAARRLGLPVIIVGRPA